MHGYEVTSHHNCEISLYACKYKKNTKSMYSVAYRKNVVYVPLTT